MKRLKQLIQFVGSTHLGEVTDVALANLQADSRQLEKADVFIALQGLQNHGLDYLQQALEAKIACVLCDRRLTESEQACLDAHAKTAEQPMVTVLVVEDVQVRLANMANWFYEQPSQKLKVVGVTGTNGKTSTANYIAQLLLQLEQQPALIGTLGNGLMKDGLEMSLEKAVNTTPDVVTVFRLLNQFYQQGANWVIMEVSSHALALGRIKEVEFSAVALTQVTRDHLDFHGSEANYHQAKMKLFTDYISRVQILNGNDAVAQTILDRVKLSNPFAYSFVPNPQARLQCLKHELSVSGIALDLAFQSVDESNNQIIESEQACLRLMGSFNIENVLCAMSVLLASGFKWQVVLPLLANLNAVNGRMHKVATRPTVIVDFAHTPDALQQVLQALAPHLTDRMEGDKLTGQSCSDSSGSNVWVVFGCGGDRDRGKRPLMAQIAEKYADKVVLTSDNPRFENLGQIMADTMAGFKMPNRVEVIEPRQKAIEYALSHAGASDVVLIAGKGHENYQDIAGVKQPFSDQGVVLNWMKQRTHVN